MILGLIGPLPGRGGPTEIQSQQGAEATFDALGDLGQVPDVSLLQSDGVPRSLSALLKGKRTLLSLIYATCSEEKGCPYATSVLHQAAKQWLQAHPDAPDVRLLSVSFDLQRDSPETLEAYARSFRLKGIDWRFLVPQNARALEDLLRGLGQHIEADPETGGYGHLVRVFLIDGAGHVRNSYTPSNLDAGRLVSDLETLGKRVLPKRQAADSRQWQRSGDDKQGYERSAYVTHAESLSRRKGHPQVLWPPPPGALLGLVHPLKGAPARSSASAIALGRKLFFDRRLSANGTLSCAMCHIPEQGFASQEQATSIGIEGKTVRRNAPGLLNVGQLSVLFHDGREINLENQVLGPLLADNEMGNKAIGQVILRLQGLKDYRGLFERAFGKGPTPEGIGAALAAYERTLVAAGSPFDRWRYLGEHSALDASQRRGYALFTGKAGCNGCHLLDDRQALLTDQQFHNTGVGYRQSMEGSTAPIRVQLAPGVFASVDAQRIGAVSEPRPSDLGRYEVTLDPNDRWAYRTPSLRNVALTPPYMHDGSLPTLEDVVAFYRQGGIPNPGLDGRMHPLALTAQDTEDLTAFLKSLTSPFIGRLVEDAWAAPIGDPGTEGHARSASP